MKRVEGRGSVLGPLEADVMRVVWDEKRPMTVREVLARLNEQRREPLAYTTVMTVMSRLAEKEILRRHQQGRGFVYESAVGNQAAVAVRGILRDFGDSAVASFVDEARADPKLLRRLRRLLREET